MSIILEKPVRKIRVKSEPKDWNGRSCIICGNMKNDDLSYGFKNDSNDRVKVNICKSLSTCANIVSTFLTLSDN